jgi:hypothetical protein
LYFPLQRALASNAGIPPVTEETLMDEPAGDPGLLVNRVFPEGSEIWEFERAVFCEQRCRLLRGTIDVALQKLLCCFHNLYLLGRVVSQD